MISNNHRKGHHQHFYHQMLVSSHIGGAAKLAIEIHEHAVKRYGEVSQLLLPKGGEAERLAFEKRFPYINYKLDWLQSSNRLMGSLANFHLQLKLRKHGEGIIHIHSPFVYGAISPFLFLSNLKTVLHIHLDFKEKELGWSLRFPPDLIFVCANFIRSNVENALPRRKGRKTKIEILLNAVDTKRFFPSNRSKAKAALGIDPDIPLLMMIANLAPHKGQETALRTVAALKKIGHYVRLCVVGQERDASAHYSNFLKKMSAELGIDQNVQFMGFRNDVPELLRAADIVLLPSNSEGLPLVILEAQATKSVVLAAPTAGIPEVVENGKTGYLIKSDDHDGYTQTISYLLRNRDKIGKVSENAYMSVRDKCNIDHYCTHVFEEYRRLLGSEL